MLGVRFDLFRNSNNNTMPSHRMYFVLKERLEHTRLKHTQHRYKFPEILQRAADADAGSRDQFQCEVCGETYIAEANYLKHVKYCKYDDMVSGHDKSTSCMICGEAFPSRQNLENHIQYCVADEDDDDDDKPLLQKNNRRHRGYKRKEKTESMYGPGTSHISLDTKPRDKNRTSPDALNRFFEDSNLEIIAIVEGVDPITSVSLQSRHSYHARSGDILFDRQFAPCTSVSPVDGHCVVDYVKFHETLPLNGEKAVVYPPCSQ